MAKEKQDVKNSPVKSGKDKPNDQKELALQPLELLRIEGLRHQQATLEEKLEHLQTQKNLVRSDEANLQLKAQLKGRELQLIAERRAQVLKELKSLSEQCKDTKQAVLDRLGIAEEFHDFGWDPVTGDICPTPRNSKAQ